MLSAPRQMPMWHLPLFASSIFSATVVMMIVSFDQRQSMLPSMYDALATFHLRLSVTVAIKLRGETVMNNFAQELRHEHQMIHKVLAAMSTVADLMELGQELQASMLAGLVQFIRVFAGERHYRK